jgi:segregation and condensation protein B
MEETPLDQPSAATERALKAAIEAIVYVADEPVTAHQIAAVLEGATVEQVLSELAALEQQYQQDAHGIEIREVAGGYKMFTKPEHHDAVRRFVKSLTPPLRLSMAALETLATIAYRQPITVPEIQAIRGVQGAGVLKTLLERKLITTAGRKNVLGRPILYKTSRDFLVQFGLSGLRDLPSIEEFEELIKASFGDAAASAQSPLPETGSGKPRESGGAEDTTEIPTPEFTDEPNGD